jgi:hypothetical protein
MAVIPKQFLLMGITLAFSEPPLRKQNPLISPVSVNVWFGITWMQLPTELETQLSHASSSCLVRGMKQNLASTTPTKGFAEGL